MLVKVEQRKVVLLVVVVRDFFLAGCWCCLVLVFCLCFFFSLSKFVRALHPKSKSVSMSVLNQGGAFLLL